MITELSELEMSSDGYTVRRNGVTMRKPEGMSDLHWFKYEAPRCGKLVGGKDDHLYGQKANMPLWGEGEMEDGCGSGACAI